MNYNGCKPGCITTAVPPLVGYAALQSVLYAAKPEFQPVSGRFVQLINTHPNDNGLHWLCFSNFNCGDGIVNLYDTSGST